MSEITWEVMKLSDLTPADYNPREITDEAMEGLENAIGEFGLVQNLVWNRRTGNLVGGHQRMKVLAAKGETDVMVCRIDVPLEREKALNVVLNNPHIAGTFDDGLQSLLEEIRDDDAHLFRDVHLDKLLSEEGTGTPGEDDVPDVPEVAVSKLGDVWLLGEHRVMCGSSTEHADVMKLVGDRHAVCMWTDPPYGIDYGGGGKTDGRQAGKGRVNPSKTRGSVIANDGDKDVVGNIVIPAFKLADEYVLAPGSSIYVAAPSQVPGDFAKFIEAVTKAGWRPRQMIVWAKDRLAISRMDYHPRHELIIYGNKPGDGRFGRFGGSGWHGDNKQSSVVNLNKPSVSKLHPTMKPVSLVVQHLINSSRPLDWIYEPFGGSGTTLIAADQLGRRCMAMELDPLYCDVIVKRWEEQTGKKAKLEGSQVVADPDPEPAKVPKSKAKKRPKAKAKK